MTTTGRPGILALRVLPDGRTQLYAPRSDYNSPPYSEIVTPPRMKTRVRRQPLPPTRRLIDARSARRS